MGWTVGRRITVAFIGFMVLLIAVVALSWWSLDRTRAAFTEALEEREQLLVPTYAALAEMRAANAEYLRYLLTREPRYMTAFDTLVRNVRARVQGTREAFVAPGVRAPAGARSQAFGGPLDEALADLGRWEEAVDDVVAAARAGDMARALELRSAVAAPLRARLEGELLQAVDSARAIAAASARQGTETSRDARVTLFVGSVLATIAGILTALWLTRSVTRPLQETSSVVATSATQILAAATQQAAGANETLAAVSESVATVDEVAQTAEQASERARQVADASQRAAEFSRSGRKAVADSVAAMGAVREQVEGIGESILTLAEQAQAIGEIIAAVNDIAEQTNILALNAAVEAARAGEQGRGFAVVAGEVKSLAEQSKRSTVQVRQILGDIQRATSAAVMATERGTKQVATASQQIGDAGETIRSLADAVGDAAQAASQIAASAGQQAIGMNQIRQAVASIHDATQQNLSAARESELAARDLNRLGERMLALVGTSGTEPVRRG